MRVLDIGCGAGDSSFVAADIVGPSGSVVGVDRVHCVLEAARARCVTRGIGHVQFREGEIDDLPLDTPVDALIGRFVLMHQRDPAHTLRQAARNVRPGGLIAVLESHMCASVSGIHSCPNSPTYDRLIEVIVESLRAAGAHIDMGLRLRQVFVEAGLPVPQLRLQARVEGGPGAVIYGYMAESLRSLLPVARELGVTTLLPEQIDELERQLEQEVAARGGVLTSPIVVGAWCHVPARVVPRRA